MCKTILNFFWPPSTCIAFDPLFIVQYSIWHFWHLWHQSVCLIHLIYIVDSNSKYSNYMKLQLKALNYKNFEVILWIRDTSN